MRMVQNRGLRIYQGSICANTQVWWQKPERLPASSDRMLRAMFGGDGPHRHTASALRFALVPACTPPRLPSSIRTAPSSITA